MVESRPLATRQTCRARVMAGVAVLASVGLLLASALGCRPAAAPAAAIPNIQVTVAHPLERSVTDFDDYTGRTASPETVEIRSRVTGYLTKVYFKDGDEVKKNDRLFEIDRRPFRAEYDKALAEIKVREANLKYREAEVKRNQPLVARSVVTESDFDLIVASKDEAQASVASAKATAESALLNLDFTEIVSPINGNIGRTFVTYGNLVQADGTLLTTVVSMDPMFVYFNVDERTLLHVREGINNHTIDIGKNDVVPVYMGLVNEEGYPHQGTMDFIDNKVDANTGTIQIRGVFPNPRHELGPRTLSPGMFARVRVPIGKPHKAIVISERAIASDQGQKLVYVVDAKGVVEYRRVTLGLLDNGMREIKAGLTVEDRVIVIGLQRVRPGMTVEVKETSMASFDQATRPLSSAEPTAPADKPAEEKTPREDAKTESPSEKTAQPAAKDTRQATDNPQEPKRPSAGQTNTGPPDAAKTKDAAGKSGKGDAGRGDAGKRAPGKADAGKSPARE